jgi:hypothetical protein
MPPTAPRRFLPYFLCYHCAMIRHQAADRYREQFSLSPDRSIFQLFTTPLSDTPASLKPCRCHG